MSARKELEIFFGAIRFFTRLPVPAWVGHSGEALQKSSRYFPAVGLIIGTISALSFTLSSFFWPKPLAVLTAMAITLYLTGAFHEDGWSDMVDGFGGGWEKTRILTIMKDSCIGSFGAIGLAMMMLAKFFLLLEIDLLLVPLSLVAGHAFSRLCATFVLRALDYVRDEGKSKPLSTRIGNSELLFATTTGILPLLLLPLPQAALGVTLSLIGTLYLAQMFRRRIGGYTGDCLGATQQLAEVAFYGGFLCKFS